jgi:hypothetical protein
MRAALLAGVVAVAVACGRSGGEVRVDGVLDEPVWNRPAVRGVFLGSDGAEARPYSEVRVVVGEDAVYVALYAADEDIRSEDRFDVELGALQATFGADGRVSDARVRAAVGRDGTLDDGSDHDEEWVVEAAVPRAVVGAGPWELRAARCDVTLAGERRCGEWRGVVRGD